MFRTYKFSAFNYDKPMHFHNICTWELLLSDYNNSFMSYSHALSELFFKLSFMNQRVKTSFPYVPIFNPYKT